MKRVFQKDDSGSRGQGKSGRSAIVGTAAVLLTLASGTFPVYAATSSSVGVSTTTSTYSSSTTSSSSGSTQNGAPQDPKLSQQDALAVVQKQFSSVVGHLNPPMVNLQSNPITNGQSVYAIDWQPMAGGRQAGPQLGQNYAHAMVDANTGQVVQFQYSGSSWSFKKTIDLSSAETIAKDWVKKLAPKQVDSLVLADKTQVQGGFSFLFVRQMYGLMAPFDSIRLQLASDGTISYYSFSWHDATFPANDPRMVLTQSQAQQVYDDHLKLALRYQQTYSPQGPGPIKLVYQPISDAPGNALRGPLPVLDAQTGQELGADGTVLTPQAPADNTLTPIDPNGPKEFPQPLKTPLTKAQVTAQVTKQLGLDGPDWTVQNVQQTNSGGNTLPSHMRWSLNFQNTKTQAGVSVQVDATDGVILNYNAYTQGPSQPSSSPLTAKELQAKADATVAKLFPNLTGAIAHTQSNFYGLPPNQMPFLYDFIVNGIPIQGFQIMMNTATGEVQNLFVQTDPSMAFPSPSKAISMQAALNAYEKANPIVLQYMLPQKSAAPNRPIPLQYGSVAKLVYTAVPQANPVVGLNAITGQWDQVPLLGSQGATEPSLPKNATPQQQAIAILQQHNVITGSQAGSSDTVNPAAVMTRGRFIAWLSRAYNMNISGTPSPQFPDVTPNTPYAGDMSTAILQGWIHNQGPIHPGDPLTRAQAAQWLVEWLGWQGPAAHSEFFKVNFSDAKSVPTAEVGPAVMMSDSGVLPLQNGKFMPNEKLTVGDTATALLKAVQVYLSSNQ